MLTREDEVEDRWRCFIGQRLNMGKMKGNGVGKNNGNKRVSERIG